MLNLSSKARLYVNVIAVRKYNFLDSFLFCFVYKTIFAVTIDSKYHSLNWKDVSVTNVDIFEKKQFSLQFLYSLFQVYIVDRVSFIFHLNVFLVSVFTRGFGYLLCWPRGRGIGLVCTRRFSFHEFYNFLLFIFLFFRKTFFFTHDIYPHPHPRPTTSTHYPRPTTFSYTRLADVRGGEMNAWQTNPKGRLRGG